MTYYLKFAAVYLSTILLCGIVNFYDGLSEGMAAFLSVLFIFLSVPIWAFWAGKGQST